MGCPSSRYPRKLLKGRSPKRPRRPLHLSRLTPDAPPSTERMPRIPFSGFVVLGLWVSASPARVQALRDQYHQPVQGTSIPVNAGQARQAMVLFPVAFYGKGANSLEQRDPLVAGMTDSILRSELAASARFRLIDSALLTQSLAQAEGGGRECISLDCR